MDEHLTCTTPPSCKDIVVANEVLKVSPSTQLVDCGYAFATEEIFSTRKDLVNWARDVGKNHGFVVSIFRSSTGGVGKETLVLGCARSGKYRPCKNSLARNVNKSKKCECPFKLRGKPLKNGEGWKVTVLCGYHNHQRSEVWGEHDFAGQLSGKEKSLPTDMTKNQVKTRSKLLSRIPYVKKGMQPHDAQENQEEEEPEKQKKSRASMASEGKIYKSSLEYITLHTPPTSSSESPSKEQARTSSRVSKRKRQPDKGKEAEREEVPKEDTPLFCKTNKSKYQRKGRIVSFIETTSTPKFDQQNSPAIESHEPQPDPLDNQPSDKAIITIELGQVISLEQSESSPDKSKGEEQKSSSKEESENKSKSGSASSPLEKDKNKNEGQEEKEKESEDDSSIRSCGNLNAIPLDDLILTSMIEEDPVKALEGILKGELSLSLSKTQQSTNISASTDLGVFAEPIISEIRSLAFSQPIDQIVQDASTVDRIKQLYKNLYHSKDGLPGVVCKGLSAFQELFEEALASRVELSQTDMAKQQTKLAQVLNTHEMRATKENYDKTVAAVLRGEEGLASIDNTIADLRSHLDEQEKKRELVQSSLEGCLKQKQDLTEKSRTLAHQAKDLMVKLHRDEVVLQELNAKIGKIASTHAQMIQAPPF